MAVTPFPLLVQGWRACHLHSTLLRKHRGWPRPYHSLFSEKSGLTAMANPLSSFFLRGSEDKTRAETEKRTALAAPLPLHKKIRPYGHGHFPCLFPGKGWRTLHLLSIPVGKRPRHCLFLGGSGQMAMVGWWKQIGVHLFSSVASMYKSYSQASWPWPTPLPCMWKGWRLKHLFSTQRG